MGNLKDEYCIVGVGETAYMRGSNRTTWSMAVEAVKKCLEDAGLRPGDVDGMMSYARADSVSSTNVAHGLGINLNFYMDVWGGSTSAEALIGLAMGAIEAGMCHTVVIFRSMNGFSGSKQGTFMAAPIVGDEALISAYGLGSPATIFSFSFARHMMEYGTTNEQLAAVKVAYSQHASNNPKALYKKRVTVDDVLNSRWIAKPAVHMLDCCIESDNATAIIVTSADRARNLKQKPIHIMAVAGRVTKGREDRMGHYQRGPITRQAGYYASRALYRNAGVGPEDIDITGCYDAFTFTNVMLFEGYGFCAEGEGGEYVSSGIINLGGRRPSNTSGGQLCEGYTHGISLIIENVRQLRGTVDDFCPNWQQNEHSHDYSEGRCRAVRNPKIAMNMSWGTAGLTSAVILRKPY